MTSFEIILNGEKVSSASLNSEYGVITTIVTCIKRIGEEHETIELDISGLDSQTQNRWEWLSKELQNTDEITIKILPSGETEPPSIMTIEAMQKRMLENNLKTFYRLREQLKDHIKPE